MTFTIEADYRPGDHDVYELVHQFDDDTLSSLYDDLGPTEQQVKEHNAAVQLEKQNIPLLHEFPTVSYLHYVDEGNVYFKGPDIRRLRADCATVDLGP
jgi:hypothetical protein